MPCTPTAWWLSGLLAPGGKQPKERLSQDPERAGLPQTSGTKSVFYLICLKLMQENVSRSETTFLVNITSN